MRQLKIAKQLTDRSTKAVHSYLSDIAKYELITPEEEAELAQRIREGDRAALDRMVKANLRFVVSVAKQYQHMGLTLADLINEGNIGLVKAAQRFDETRGFKFISYAVWWIRQSILQAVVEHSRIVRLPLNQVNTITKINQAVAKLEQQVEREPTAAELAEATEFTEDKVAGTMRIATRTLSMDAPVREDEAATMADFMPNTKTPNTDSDMLHESLHHEIDRLLETLSPQESHVIKHSFGIGMAEPVSLETLGDEMGISRERVRQIREKGLRRLRKNREKTKLLRAFLG